MPAAAADDLSLEGFPLEMTLVNWSVGPSSGSHRSLFFLSLPEGKLLVVSFAAFA